MRSFDHAGEKRSIFKPRFICCWRVHLSAGYPFEQIDRPLPEGLTSRELAVMALLADGLTNYEIAQQLAISVSSAKAHTRNIYDKLNVSNRTQPGGRRG